MKKQSNAYLRFSLLRIWFVKNITVFLLSALIIFGILILTNVIDIAILEAIPGMGPIVAEFKTGMSNINQGGWITCIASISATITLVTKKAKGIRLADIASNEIKYLLVKAGLKFDVNGHLCKATDETEKTETETYLQMLFRAGREFKLIVCADINNNEDFNKIVSEANMEEAKEVVESYQNAEISVEVCEADSEGKPTNRIFGIFVKFGTSIKEGFTKIIKKIKVVFNGDPNEEIDWGDEEVIEPEIQKPDTEIPEDDAVEIPEVDDDDLSWGDGENVDDDAIVETPDDEEVVNNEPETTPEPEEVPSQEPVTIEPAKTITPQQTPTKKPMSTMDRLLAKKKH